MSICNVLPITPEQALHQPHPAESVMWKINRRLRGDREIELQFGRQAVFLVDEFPVTRSELDEILSAYRAAGWRVEFIHHQMGEGILFEW